MKDWKETINELLGIANELDEYITLPVHSEISSKIRKLASDLKQ